MENLESVVRERNRAFHELECGGSGEQERSVRSGPFGIDSASVASEHMLPAEMNEEWLEKQRRRTRSRYSNLTRTFENKRIEMEYKKTRRMKK